MASLCDDQYVFAAFQSLDLAVNEIRILRQDEVQLSVSVKLSWISVSSFMVSSMFIFWFTMFILIKLFLMVLSSDPFSKPINSVVLWVTIIISIHLWFRNRILIHTVISQHRIFVSQQLFNVFMNTHTYSMK